MVHGRHKSRRTEGSEVVGKMLSGWVGTKLLTYRDWRCEADCTGISDASGSGGFGLIVGRKWCAGEWVEEEKKLNICVLEMIPIVLASCIFGKEWRRSRV